MKQTQVIIVIVALVIGFAGGFVLRPIIAPGTPAPIASAPDPSTPASDAAQPSEAEATAAVRRHRMGFNSLSEATLTLGECGPGTIGPGVTCMTTLVMRPGSSPQNRMIGFARVNGQWEVSVIQ